MIGLLFAGEIETQSTNLFSYETVHMISVQKSSSPSNYETAKQITTRGPRTQIIRFLHFLRKTSRPLPRKVSQKQGKNLQRQEKV